MRLSCLEKFWLIKKKGLFYKDVRMSLLNWGFAKLVVDVRRFQIFTSFFQFECYSNISYFRKVSIISPISLFDLIPACLFIDMWDMKGNWWSLHFLQSLADLFKFVTCQFTSPFRIMLLISFIYIFLRAVV